MESVERVNGQESFVKKANCVHGNKYDYSKTIFTATRDKVIITCPCHGDFYQKASNHLNGNGCPGCFKERNKFTQEQFIKNAKSVHGDKYDYSKTIYKNASEKVIITCPIHGDFEQLSMSHMKGHGCNFCRHEYIKTNSRDTQEEFIRKAKEVHGDKFLYDKVEYVNSQTKVLIGCREHGYFYKIPAAHIAGNGCQRCYGNHKSTTEEFIEKANKVHNNFFDYSKVVYNMNKDKLTIICPDHGEFLQSANSHLRGNGCIRCHESKGERFIASVLDKHNVKYIREFKFPEYMLLRYDFYLPDKNLIIEFHGEQHYIPIDYFGGEEALRQTQFRDNFKRSLAREHGIRVIEFNYRHRTSLTSEKFEEIIIKNISRERKLKARRLV